MSGADREVNSEARGGGELDAWTIASAIWARRARVVLTTAVVVALTAAVLYSITPRYSSQAKLLIENRESQFTRTSRDGDDQFLSDQAAVLSQVEVLSSRDLATKVVDKLGLVDRPEFNSSPAGDSLIGRLLVMVGLRERAREGAAIERVVETYSDRLTVFQIGTSRVIAVEFSSIDAELAAGVANTLADEYIASMRTNKLDTNQEAVAWLGREIEVLRERVAEAEGNVATYRNESGLITTSRETTLSEQQLSELSAELIRASAARSEARAKAEMITHLLEEPGSIEEVADVLNSQLIQRLREQQAAVSREHAELSATMLPGHPRMRELTAELADLDKRILSEARKIARGLENEADLAGARVDAIRSSLAEVRDDAGQTSQSEVQLRALEREAAAQREILESFLRRYREATSRQDVEVQSADARIISKASVATTPSYPPRGPILGLATLVGLLVGLTSALLADMSSSHRSQAPARPIPPSTPVPAPPMRRDRRAGENDNGNANGDRRLAMVSGTAGNPPEPEAGPEVGNDAKAKTATPLTTELEGQTASGSQPLAQRLAQLVTTRGVKRFAVLRLSGTGALRDITVRLAEAAATGGINPVVVEAAPDSEPQPGDDDAAGPGLFDVLAGQAALGQTLTNAGKGAVTVVPAGKALENRDELVRSGRITLVIDALLRRFDVAFVAAGVLGEGELPTAIASPCDHVLIVFPEGEVNERRIKAVVAQLAKSGMRGVSIIGESAEGLVLHDPAAERGLVAASA